MPNFENSSLETCYKLGPNSLFGSAQHQRARVLSCSPAIGRASCGARPIPIVNFPLQFAFRFLVVSQQLSVNDCFSLAALCPSLEIQCALGFDHLLRVLTTRVKKLAPARLRLSLQLKGTAVEGVDAFTREGSEMRGSLSRVRICERGLDHAEFRSRTFERVLLLFFLHLADLQQIAQRARECQLTPPHINAPGLRAQLQTSDAGTHPG